MAIAIHDFYIMINENGVWDLNEAKKGHAHSKQLADAIIKLLPKNKCVFDLGCGTGFYAAQFAAKGYQVIAVEGTPNIDEIADYSPIIQHDLTTPLPEHEPGNVICLEVGEHIPKEHEQGFINNITKLCGGILILSWAIPGQGGRGHVNEQPNDYIINEIEKRGFVYREAKSDYLRANAGKLPWFKNTLMFFERV